jgi:hypothetical protein
MPPFLMSLDSRSLLLLGCCYRQLRRSAGASVVCSCAEHVLILARYCAWKSFAAILEGFSNDREVPSKMTTDASCN